MAGKKTADAGKASAKGGAAKAPAKSAAAKAPAKAAKGASATGGGLDAQFEQAAERAKQLPERPDNDTLLRLYALYKQGSEGDVRGEKPGFFDFVGAAKYDAWTKVRGMDRDEAKRKYVELVRKLGG